MGEQPFTRLKPLVGVLADLMESELHAPFAFYGHSMGSLISFELARELHRRHGLAPQQIFLSGHQAPPALKKEPPRYNLPDDEFIAKLGQLNGTPKGLLDDPETRELFLPLLRADFELVDTYEYVSGEPLPCPITAYGGLEDSDVPVEALHGWQKHTSSTCKVRMFPGDHFFIQTSGREFVAVLRRDVLASLPRPVWQKLETPIVISRSSNLQPSY